MDFGRRRWGDVLQLKSKNKKTKSVDLRDDCCRWLDLGYKFAFEDVGERVHNFRVLRRDRGFVIVVEKSGMKRSNHCLPCNSLALGDNCLQINWQHLSINIAAEHRRGIVNNKINSMFHYDSLMTSSHYSLQSDEV